MYNSLYIMIDNTEYLSKCFIPGLEILERPNEMDMFMQSLSLPPLYPFFFYLYYLFWWKKDYLNEIEVSFRMKYIAQGNFIILFCYSFNFMLNGFMMEWNISPHFLSLRLGKQWSRRAHIFVKRRYKVSFHNRNS